MFQHRFRWRAKAVRLVYSIEARPEGLQLVLDDVRASDLETANTVPDWRIDVEADRAAQDHGATYH